MSSNANQIIAEIEAYIRKYGGSLYEWYVGIAANVSDRLFSDHQVREKGDAWIYRQAPNHELARQVENHFVERLGALGGPGGGTAASRTVYAYKIAPHTAQ